MKNYIINRPLIVVSTTLSIKVEVKEILPHRFRNSHIKNMTSLDSFAIWQRVAARRNGHNILGGVVIPKV